MLGSVPVPVVTVSPAWVHPAVPMAGNVADAGPDWPSLTVSAKRTLPATVGRKKSVDPPR